MSFCSIALYLRISFISPPFGGRIFIVSHLPVFDHSKLDVHKSGDRCKRRDCGVDRSTNAQRSFHYRPRCTRNGFHKIENLWNFRRNHDFPRRRRRAVCHKKCRGSGGLCACACMSCAVRRTICARFWGNLRKSAASKGIRCVSRCSRNGKAICAVRHAVAKSHALKLPRCFPGPMKTQFRWVPSPPRCSSAP